MQKKEIFTSEPIEINSIVDQMCSPEALELVWHRPLHDMLMPSPVILQEIMDRLRSAIFPGYYTTVNNHETVRYHLAANLDSISSLLCDQILRGICFACTEDYDQCEGCKEQARKATKVFIARLPEIRRLLIGDARAAYEGDPAATSPGEAIFCYPSMLTMLHHRIAHELYLLKIPVIPRIISEMAHSRTGIDIHPGATIGEEFFIDHGTGVVIGETANIGRNCRLYQGVTLGALSFPKNEDGTLTKGIARHPILEDNVTVYAGATILGRITVGSGSIVGGNVWITRDVPPNSKVVQEKSNTRTHETLMGVRSK